MSMRNALAGILFGLCLLHLTGSSGFAQKGLRERVPKRDFSKLDQQTSFPGFPIKSGAVSHVGGNILHVKGDEQKFTLSMPNGKTIEVWVPHDALVSQGRYPLEISDLEVGDRVEVAYAHERSRHVAREVRVQ